MDNKELKIFELISLESRINKLKQQLKELENEKDVIKDELLENMEKENIPCIENDSIKISYVSATVRCTVDKTKLSNEYPEVFNNVIKIENVKSNLRIKLKEN